MIYIIDYRRQFESYCDGVRIQHLDSAREIPSDSTGILCHYNNNAIKVGGIPTRCRACDLLMDNLYDGLVQFPVMFFAGDMSASVQRFQMGPTNVTKLSRDELAKRLPTFAHSLDFTFLTGADDVDHSC